MFCDAVCSAEAKMYLCTEFIVEVEAVGVPIKKCTVTL